MNSPVILTVNSLNGPEISEAARYIRSGCLVVLPTDTVYGVAADAKNKNAVEKLFEVKQRDKNKPVALLTTGVERTISFGAVFNTLAERLADRFWPGPLTIVLPVENGFEGFRVPASQIALAVIEETGGVLRVTSANLAGSKPALNAEEAAAAFGDDVDLILDGGGIDGGIPSTVVKIFDNKFEVLREGALSREELLSAV